MRVVARLPGVHSDTGPTPDAVAGWGMRHPARGHGHSAHRGGAYAVAGALALYLNFINLFLMLLRLLGGRRE
jgi:hypothetical protein